MKIKIVISTLLIILYSCSFFSKSKRSVSSINPSEFDLLTESIQVIDLVATRELNGDSCDRLLDSLISDYQLVSPMNIELKILQNDGQKILANSFKARLALHSILSILPTNCRKKLTQLSSLIRRSEEYVGVHYFKDNQMSADLIKFEDQPIPLFDKNSFSKIHLGKDLSSLDSFKFENGDIVIFKGTGFFSSNMSIPFQPSLEFSHISIVHVDEKNQEIKAVVSSPNVGMVEVKIEDALRFGSIGMLIIRAKDQDLAAKASNIIFDNVQSKTRNKSKIQKMHSTLDELISDAYYNASNGEFIFPEIHTSSNYDQRQAIEQNRYPKDKLMMASKLEFDSRFNILIDSVDYRFIRDSWRKDAVMAEIFQWLSKANASKFALSSLKKIGDSLLSYLEKSDMQYFQKNEKWMSYEMLSEMLAKYDNEKFLELKKAILER